MPNWAWILAFVVVYIILPQWLLDAHLRPRLVASQRGQLSEVFQNACLSARVAFRA